MAIKVQKLSGTVSPFAGISFVNALFNQSGLSKLIDAELGMRVKYSGYQYSEIIRNLSNVFLSGGDCIEDISSHLKDHLKVIPNNQAPSPDTILRGITELSVENTQFKSTSDNIYDFNINTKLNRLNIKSLVLTNQLEAGKSYDFDYDNQVLPNKKYDAKKTYKKNKGYVPGVATIDDKIVYLEKRDDNQTDVFTQDSYKYRSILTNDWESTEKEVIKNIEIKKKLQSQRINMSNKQNDKNL